MDQRANSERTNDGSFRIVSSNGDTNITVSTAHLSCSSDVYRGDNDHKYAGFILYAYDGKTDWRLNGIHCKTGYIVIRNTDNGGPVDRYRQGSSGGQIHRAVYKSVFGIDWDNKVVGEGFAWIDGEFAVNSFTSDTSRDNTSEWMTEEGRKCVKEMLLKWKSAGQEYCCLPSCRNWSVMDLLSL